MTIMKFATATAVAALLATGASAATLSLAGVGYTAETLPSGTNSKAYNLPVPAQGTSIDVLTGDVKNNTNGLYLTGQAKVWYTYIGSEAGFFNLSMGDSWIIPETDPVGTAKQVLQLASGLLDFSFVTKKPEDHKTQIDNDGGITSAQPFNQTAIGYYKVSDTTWYAFYDDPALPDRDFDDFVIRIDLAPVPIPAAGFLLLGGLGAMGAIARRRKKS